MPQAKRMNSTLDESGDRDWVADLSASGERRDAALAALRSILAAGLRRAFHKLGPEPPLIEDSTQEALLRILGRLGSFRGESRFVTWALSIAIRVAVSELRRAHWKDVSLDEMTAAGRLPANTAHAPPAGVAYDSAQLMIVVRNAIQYDLTEKQRAVIQAELGGAPPDEIARRLGTNRNALYKLVHDARKRLKQAILRAGWTEQHVRGVLSGSQQHG